MAETAKKVQVRILADTTLQGTKLIPGRVANLLIDDAAALKAQGIADDEPKSVEYALTENKIVIDPYATAE